MLRHLVSILFCSVLFIGSGLAQDSLSDPSSPSVAPSLGEPSAKSLADFRKILISTAEAQFKAKEIGRVQLIGLRIATLNKASLERMHQVCAEQALSEGIVGSYGALDWTKLAAFIKEMLPIILELIKLFASANSSVPHLVCGNYHYHSFGFVEIRRECDLFVAA